MKRRNILNRYNRLDDGRFVIDVAAGRVRDLYNDFDKCAPYVKKDLDEDLVEFLCDCGRELTGKPFVIRLDLAEEPEDALRERIKTSIGNYFVYRKARELRQIEQRLKSSLTLLLVGVGLLLLSLWVNRITEYSSGVVAYVFAEGLTVAAWVSLWEAVGTFVIHWAPHRRLMKMYTALSRAPVYIEHPGDASASAH